MNASSKIERGPSTSLRSRVREQVRAAILDSAEQEFSARELKAVRMEDVAARAGVSVGTLYNYFGDREHLVAELLTLRGTEIIQGLDRALEEHEGSNFAQQLRALLRVMFTHIEDHRRLLTRIIDGEMESGSSSGRTAHGQLKRMLWERLAQLVQRGVDSGELDRNGSELFPTLLVGMSRAAVVHPIVHSNSTISVDERVEVCARVFLQGTRVV